jgi:hypothetical protein
VWPVVTLPKPEFVIFSSAEVSPHRQTQQVQWHSVTTVIQGDWRPKGRMPKRASARFRVQPTTPLGPDQVNVLLLLMGKNYLLVLFSVP